MPRVWLEGKAAVQQNSMARASEPPPHASSKGPRLILYKPQHSHVPRSTARHPSSSCPFYFSQLNLKPCGFYPTVSSRHPLFSADSPAFRPSGQLKRSLLCPHLLTGLLSLHVSFCPGPFYMAHLAMSSLLILFSVEDKLLSVAPRVS